MRIVDAACSPVHEAALGFLLGQAARAEAGRGPVRFGAFIDRGHALVEAAVRAGGDVIWRPTAAAALGS